VELDIANQELYRCINALEGVTDEIAELRSQNQQANAHVSRIQEGADSDHQQLEELTLSHKQVCAFSLCVNASLHCIVNV
jgi:hypothetical protein